MRMCVVGDNSVCKYVCVCFGGQKSMQMCALGDCVGVCLGDMTVRVCCGRQAPALTVRCVSGTNPLL